MISAIYKNDYMSANSIAATPPDGYEAIQNYSSESLEWLEYLRQCKNIVDLKHIANSATGEGVILNNIKVDGLDAGNKKVYQYHGCYYHACPKCFPDRYILHPHRQITYDAVYRTSCNITKRIRNAGYDVEVIWSCEWFELKKNNQDILDFINRNRYALKPLIPSLAMHGGRTETFKMLVTDPNIRMHYVDVNSLYPYVNARKRYPIGHPKIILNDFGDISQICNNYFGFIYCTVITPDNNNEKLYAPVLPGKFSKEKKLIFALCQTCAEMKQTKLCEHSIEDRCITGVWFSEELKLALEMGYEIKRVFGVHHFERTSTHLFSDYIKTFYKIKLLASGKPENCETAEQLQTYIANIKQNDDVDLTNCTFENNPSLRTVAKLCLNSLWGKFGTRPILPKPEFCKNIQELNNLFEDPALEVADIIIMHSQMVVAICKQKNLQFVDINNNCNIYLAACTTAYARIELYKYLNIVKERAVYCDTDSLIYISEPGNDIETGEYLGQMKNELDKDEYIIKFVSGGLKNYAFITNKNKAVIKLKGFVQTITNTEAINFDNFEKIVEAFAIIPANNEDDEEIDETDRVTLKSAKVLRDEKLLMRERAAEVHNAKPSEHSAMAAENFISVYNPVAIARTKCWDLVQKKEQKIFTVNYDKRIVTTDFNTFPYGYR
jgi:hypothetical protein